MAETVYTGGGGAANTGSMSDPNSSGGATYEQAFESVSEPLNPYHDFQILGGTGLISEELFDNVVDPGTIEVDYLNSGSNIIARTIQTAAYDQANVEEIDSYSIFELLPNPGLLPATAPVNLEVYVANWSRLYKWGGIIDETRDPNPNYITDWSVLRLDKNTGNNALFPDFYDAIHMLPEETALDPTYMFYTGDPGIFYAKRAISHYAPDKYGNPKAVLVPPEDIVWKLDGKEVHRGWFLNMDIVQRTVDIIPPADSGQDSRLILVPRRITCEAHNDAGMTSKEVKYGAIDNQDTFLIGGNPDPATFSSTYQGRYHAREDNVTGEKRVEFEKDPRYGARRCYIRFAFKDYDDKYAPRSKFKDAEFHFTFEHNPDNIYEGAIAYARGEDVYDPYDKGLWTPLGYIGGDTNNKRHQDAYFEFPNLFDSNGRIHEEHRNVKGGILSEFGITDMTGGTNSALLTDEESTGYQSKLFSFDRKPGPFAIAAHIQFKKKKKQTIYFGYFSFGRQDGDPNEIKFDTPLQPIDLGVRTLTYKRE